ncbi:9100_t:CDS:2 [Funneliformis geosporum]|uniref:9100_t:CDS:1 n=1 Tax=Funneliformis geosporum TaxID=1117311 RepID=A0A9W4SX03_9GLOM|nr:9100_t:CDS:2 [Funneliformis geosporum]
MISLIEDCIYQVLQWLKEDRETLFNCLFVNSFFCKNFVPLLYSNPFGQELKYINEYFLISTFLKCLDAEEKNYLRQVNINLTDENEITLFEYETYLEKLSINDLTDTIRIWLMFLINDDEVFVGDKTSRYSRQFGTRSIDDKETKLMVQATLFHMFTRKSRKIKSLEIKPIIFNSKFLNKRFFNEISRNLSTLKDLKLCLFTGYFEKIREPSLLEFLNTIAKNCTYITELGVIIDEKFDNCKFHSYIINIINNQKKLLKFTLSEPRYIGSNIVLNIVLSLESQRDSLKSIQLDFVHLCHDHISVLANCSNLKNLRLYYCGGMTLDHCNLILDKSVCKVEKLTMTRNRWSKDITASIISTLGRSLKRLSFDQISSETLESIISYCPNLKVLEVQFGKFDYLLLKRMNIDHLIIHPIFDLSLDFKELLQDLGSSLPITIKHFTFITHNSLSSDNLKTFLSNINSCLKRSLKFLGIKKLIPLESTMYFLDDELINNIRNLGVKIFFLEKNYESDDEFYNLVA